MVIPEVGNDLVAGRVDGTYADNEMAVRALLGPASYRVAAASFLTNAGPPSASTYVRTMSGGLRASEHVPAAVSDLQDAYTVRGMMSPAVLPRWEGIALIRGKLLEVFIVRPVVAPATGALRCRLI